MIRVRIALARRRHQWDGTNSGLTGHDEILRDMEMFTFYEFFAGGGMVRAGLGDGWRCLLANDFDHKKSRVYGDNWGEAGLMESDVRKLTVTDLPGQANLAWASFPCQDLSLAGSGAGLKGDRSGTFRPFWKLMKGLVRNDRAPHIIALENVCGTLTSHGGRDFGTICFGFVEAGYRVGALVVDAALFVPQSRQRLFIVGVRQGIELPPGLSVPEPTTLWHNAALRRAYGKLSGLVKSDWIWWNPPTPERRRSSLSDLIEESPTDVSWFTAEETARLLSQMSDVNLAKIEKAKLIGRPMVGGVYKRTRKDEYGRKVQRAEVRFDDVAGCLRTPAGGSSRQVLVKIDGDDVRARLLSGREAARLMGLPETYKLPTNYNESYHLTGDGVVVPVVRHLAEHLFEPILTNAGVLTMVAA